jgi:hypothetical protein
MGIAVPVAEPRPAVSWSYACQERTPRSPPDPFADFPDGPFRLLSLRSNPRGFWPNGIPRASQETVQ